MQESSVSRNRIGAEGSGRRGRETACRESTPGAERLFSDAGKDGVSVLDVRSRMFVTLLASAVTVGISSFEGQMVLFAASLLYACLVRRWRALAVAYAAMVLMMLLAAACTWGLSRVVPAVKFSPESLAVPFLRGAVMLNVVLPLALTSRIQALLTALKSLRLPFCIYIPAAVMIRFIPTFMNDIRQVAETLKIRGYHPGPGEMFRHPLMMLRLLFTPLLFRSLRTSEELGIAAELKGLEAGGTFVPFRESAWSGRDTLLVLFAVAVSAAAVYCQVRWGGAFVPAMR